MVTTSATAALLAGGVAARVSEAGSLIPLPLLISGEKVVSVVFYFPSSCCPGALRESIDKEVHVFVGFFTLNDVAGDIYEKYAVHDLYSSTVLTCNLHHRPPIAIIVT